MLEMIREMIQGAPAWIWLVFGVIMARGVRALNQRVIYFPIPFIVSAVLVILKLIYGVKNDMVIYYAIGLFTGIVAGYIKTQNQKGIVINKKTMEVTIPGSPQLLVVLLFFFVVKYFFGYLGAVHAEIALEYMWLESVLTAGIIGYLWGNSASYLRRYLQA